MHYVTFKLGPAINKGYKARNIASLVQAKDNRKNGGHSFMSSRMNGAYYVVSNCAEANESAIKCHAEYVGKFLMELDVEYECEFWSN